MKPHRLKVDVIEGLLVVSCECGRWERRRLIQNGERPTQVMEELEKEHEKHVGEAGDNNGTK